jgi:phosphoserine phosphatase
LSQDLIVEGGALPTFLLERIAAATMAAAVRPCPPQMVVFQGAADNAAFGELVPLIAAEKLRWRFVEAGS